jgi:hypothetical protein
MVSGLSALGFDPNAPATAQPVCILVTPNTLTARRISFIFNKLVCRRSRCGSTGTLVSPFLSPPCEPFPLQQGGTPPLLYPERSPRRAHLHRLPFLQSALFPAVHPISLQSLTKCSSRNFFVLTTIHFHGGCTPPRVYPEPASARRGANLGGGEAESFCARIRRVGALAAGDDPGVAAEERHGPNHRLHLHWLRHDSASRDYRTEASLIRKGALNT